MTRLGATASLRLRLAVGPHPVDPGPAPLVRGNPPSLEDGRVLRVLWLVLVMVLVMLESGVSSPDVCQASHAGVVEAGSFLAVKGVCRVRVFLSLAVL